jgi:hypothetical protein
MDAPASSHEFVSLMATGWVTAPLAYDTNWAYTRPYE